MQRITFVNTMMGRRRSWGGDEDGGGEAPRGELTFPPRRDSSLPLPLLASTIIHTQLITSGSIWRKSEIFLEGCRVPQNVAHYCVFWNFLRYPAWAAGRHLILLCNVHAAKTATLSPGLISASQGFIQQMHIYKLQCRQPPTEVTDGEACRLADGL